MIYKNEIKQFNNLLNSLEKIPAIGKKSALKIALSLSLEDKHLGLNLAHCLEEAALHTTLCIKCNAISNNEICPICAANDRDTGKLCIVLSQKDVFTLEETNQFKGKYFVITSAENLDFVVLQNRIIEEKIEEIIFAFAPNNANDALIILIEDRLKDFNINYTKIAHGIPTNIGLENVDRYSLEIALKNRYKAI